mmetsp:Transcript_18917/g.52776  ORF Transcript_18917/g.52776 Transcript_18917/m.52776 type:complete len:224 (-) Transcript_18917:574-1245(-)
MSNRPPLCTPLSKYVPTPAGTCTRGSLSPAAAGPLSHPPSGVGPASLLLRRCSSAPGSASPWRRSVDPHLGPHQSLRCCRAGAASSGPRPPEHPRAASLARHTSALPAPRPIPPPSLSHRTPLQTGGERARKWPRPSSPSSLPCWAQQRSSSRRVPSTLGCPWHRPYPSRGPVRAGTEQGPPSSSQRPPSPRPRPLPPRPPSGGSPASTRCPCTRRKFDHLCW